MQGREVITVVFAVSSSSGEEGQRPSGNDDDQGFSPDDDASDATGGLDDRGPAGQASGTSQAPASSDSIADFTGANTVCGHSAPPCAVLIGDLLVESSFHVRLGQLSHCLYILARLAVLITFASILLMGRNGRLCTAFFICTALWCPSAAVRMPSSCGGEHLVVSDYFRASEACQTHSYSMPAKGTYSNT